MLVLYRDEQRWEDRRFVKFTSFLQPGDCLVLNNSKVIPSRLSGLRVPPHRRVADQLPPAADEPLVCALGGKDFVLSAYRHALEQRYRFYSYGDCMLIV